MGKGDEMNREIFFTKIRHSLFHGRLSDQQVEGIETMLNYWESQGGGYRPQLSYMLATAYHETGAKMQPIPEIGKGKGKKYGVPGRNNGQVPYGRGLIQTTWDENYEKTDHLLGLNSDLIANYDLLLTLPIAVPALMRGMKEGWYAKYKGEPCTLDRFIYKGHISYLDARRIVNGTDKAAQIADYAELFDEAILAAVA
jgi:hypothetical protein